ncbi:MAG: RNA polymerase subunit sigma-70 [Steroidobacteraceae bacterium]
MKQGEVKGRARAATTGSHEIFQQLAEPLRRDLRLHCYRMLGSVHEAEDLVQETYLRAWRSFNDFDRATSIRPWLYRIATNACLNALQARKRSRRYLPDQVGPSVLPKPPGEPAMDIPWLGPIPSHYFLDVKDEAPTPEMRYSTNESVRLAFIAAIQDLPARQRAILLLCDVLGFTASEVAGLLGSSVASVNSGLQRARESLARRHSNASAPLDHARHGQHDALLARYLEAWESHDAAGLAALLKEDATAIMPPWREWFAGRKAIVDFFSMAWTQCKGLRLVPIAGNGQAGFAAYQYTGAENKWAANALHLLTFDGAQISSLALFVDAALFEIFDLPLEITAEPRPLRQAH